MWYVIDAKNKILGRLATRIVPILIGKHKPTFTPHAFDNGDHVIVINAQEIAMTGDKWDRKLIRWHTGWPGGLKEYPAKVRHEWDPTELVRRAISRMLPKNKQRQVRLDRLHIVAGNTHKYDAQNPLPLDVFQKDAVTYQNNY